MRDARDQALKAQLEAAHREVGTRAYSPSRPSTQRCVFRMLFI